MISHQAEILAENVAPICKRHVDGAVRFLLDLPGPRVWMVKGDIEKSGVTITAACAGKTVCQQLE